MDFQLGPYRLVLHSQPLDILQQFSQSSRKAPEAGGIILGKLINGGINITKLSVPTSLDKSSRMNFERSKVGAQIILDYEFYNSNGQITYLGEWHTHPERQPTPSFTDLHMIKDQFKYNTLHANIILLIIKGTENLYIRLIDKEGYYECCI